MGGAHETVADGLDLVALVFGDELPDEGVVPVEGLGHRLGDGRPQVRARLDVREQHAERPPRVPRRRGVVAPPPPQRDAQPGAEQREGRRPGERRREDHREGVLLRPVDHAAVAAVVRVRAAGPGRVEHREAPQARVAAAVRVPREAARGAEVRAEGDVARAHDGHLVPGAHHVLGRRVRPRGVGGAGEGLHHRRRGHVPVLPREGRVARAHRREGEVEAGGVGRGGGREPGHEREGGRGGGQEAEGGGPLQRPEPAPQVRGGAQGDHAAAVQPVQDRRAVRRAVGLGAVGVLLQRSDGAEEEGEGGAAGGGGGGPEADGAEGAGHGEGDEGHELQFGRGLDPQVLRPERGGRGVGGRVEGADRREARGRGRPPDAAEQPRQRVPLREGRRGVAGAVARAADELERAAPEAPGGVGRRERRGGPGGDLVGQAPPDAVLRDELPEEDGAADAGRGGGAGGGREAEAGERGVGDVGAGGGVQDRHEDAPQPRVAAADDGVAAAVLAVERPERQVVDDEEAGVVDLVQHRRPRDARRGDAPEDLDDEAPGDVALEGQGVGALAVGVVQVRLRDEAARDRRVWVGGHWDDLDDRERERGRWRAGAWREGGREGGGWGGGGEREG